MHVPSAIASRRPSAKLFALAGALAACTLAPTAAHAATTPSPFTCQTTGQPVSQVFSGFGDFSEYTPVPDAGLEAGGSGWTLAGGAAVVSDDNEPWYVAGPGTHALDLPQGSAAVTPPICIDPSYPYFRLFAEDVNASGAGLEIEVLSYDGKGRIQKTTPLTYTAAADGWQATGQLPISVYSGATSTAATPVAFLFVPQGANAHFRIDDVYVDPWARS